MISPTVGRNVWYHPGGDEAGTIAKGQHLAAIIADVKSDRCVNLMVIDSYGQPSSRLDVQLLQDDDVAPVGVSFAEWQSFQKEQATKVAIVE